MSNLLQYAPILAANGVVTRFNSADATLNVVESPKTIRTVMDKVVEEISAFSDTRTPSDSMAGLCLANYIDEDSNPISETAKLNILHALDIMRDGKFVRPALALQLQNRSWHPSTTPNECENFGELCTHRGITTDPNRKGRTSHRKPDEYHPQSGDIIAREQLVTPNLRTVFNSIPKENLIGHREPVDIPSDIKRKFKMLSVEDQVALMEDWAKEIA